MAKDDELINHVMREVIAESPGMSPATALAIEARVRARWGGSRVYIGKGMSTGKARCLGAAIAAGASLRDAFAAAGLTSRSGWRTLSRKWSVR
jgi:hypothetical protein